MNFIRQLGCLVLFQAFLAAMATGQEAHKKHSRNTIYAEYNLEGPDYALNYDRIFTQTGQLAFSFHAGISVLKDRYALPFGVSMLTGKDGHHAAFGLTFAPYWEVKRSIYGGKNDDRSLFIFPSAGYRYQRKRGGWFGQAAMGPMIQLNPPAYDVFDFSTTVRYSFNLGMGYSF